MADVRSGRKPDVDLAALRALVERVFPRTGVSVERAAHGASTQVYQLVQANEVFFLRIAEDRSGAEVLVHRTLAARGVRVPEIVHYEPFDPDLDRSVMITRAIPGGPLRREDRRLSPGVLRGAGRELAIVNSIPVDGFGFVDRTQSEPTRLSVGIPSGAAFVERDLWSDLDLVVDILGAPTVRRIERLIESWRERLEGQPSVLAHGDLDATHVYHHAGVFTGFIDFGEIRGADRLYDLAHALFRDGDTLATGTTRALVDGYREVSPLTPEDEARLSLWRVLIGVRSLARTLDRLSTERQRRVATSIRAALKSLPRSDGGGAATAR